MTTTQDQQTQATPSESEEKTTRAYRVIKEVKLDPSDPISVANQLEALHEKDDDGKPVGLLTVYALIGVGDGANPKQGLNEVAQNHDLAGDYEVVSVSNITSFKNVSASTRRVVSVG